MSNLAEKFDAMMEFDDGHDDGFDCDVVELRAAERESLSENFMAELEAWARHSLAANGFGDF